MQSPRAFWGAHAPQDLSVLPNLKLPEPHCSGVLWATCCIGMTADITGHW